MKTNKKVFYQWDIDQRLELPSVVPGTEIHFSNPAIPEPDCLAVFAYEEDGAVYAKIPNAILQVPGCFKVYVWPFHTTQFRKFTVLARPKPADYIYEEAEILTVEKVVDEIIKLQESLMPQPKIIRFFDEYDIPIQYDQGMTWRDWLASAYNTLGWRDDYGTVMCGDSFCLRYLVDYREVNATDIISEAEDICVHSW